MLTVDELRERIASGVIDTVLVVFTDLYGRPIGKRYDARFFMETALEGGAHACDYLLTADMEMQPVPGYDFANWERGYGDVHLLPDLATLRHLSWLDRTAMVQCDVAEREGHGLLSLAPRSLLRTQADQAAARGFEVMAASELEFYMYRTSYREGAKSGFTNMDPTGSVNEDYHVLQGTREEDFIGALRRHLHDSGVPVETSKGEWGHGQHELNVRYTNIVTMADRHAVYKQCVKEVADQMERSVTFMAKPSEDGAGSSCHIHLSLWRDGKNAFAGEEVLGYIRCSKTFRHFLAGWIAHTSDLMVLYAPTVNSYKRYQAGSWAPTRLAWSYDNRTAGFRVVGAGPSLRIECRIPGADANPYLAFAAALASGLDGVERELEPPPIFEGDVYAAEDLPAVPVSLSKAIDAFEASAFARQAFGEAFVEHYVHFLRHEQACYDRAVTDWERGRYFEQI